MEERCRLVAVESKACWAPDATLGAGAQHYAAAGGAAAVGEARQAALQQVCARVCALLRGLENLREGEGAQPCVAAGGLGWCWACSDVWGALYTPKTHTPQTSVEQPALFHLTLCFPHTLPPSYPPRP